MLHLTSMREGSLDGTNEGKILGHCSLFSVVEGKPCVFKRAYLIVALPLIWGQELALHSVHSIAKHSMQKNRLSAGT